MLMIIVNFKEGDIVSRDSQLFNYWCSTQNMVWEMLVETIRNRWRL